MQPEYLGKNLNASKTIVILKFSALFLFSFPVDFFVLLWFPFRFSLRSFTDVHLCYFWILLKEGTIYTFYYPPPPCIRFEPIYYSAFPGFSCYLLDRFVVFSRFFRVLISPRTASYLSPFNSDAPLRPKKIPLIQATNLSAPYILAATVRASALRTSCRNSPR